MKARNLRKTIFTAPLALLVALIPAGCGSGSGSATTRSTQPGAPVPTTPTSGARASTTAPAKPRSTPTGTSAATGTRSAISAANSICARRSRELGRIPASGGSMPALAAAARRRARIEAQALGELEKLTLPAAQAAHYRELLALARASLLGVVKVGELAQAGNAAGARAARAKAGTGKLRLLIVAARARLRECAGIPALE